MLTVAGFMFMLVLQSCVLYPVIVIIGDNRDYTRVLLYSY